MGLKDFLKNRRKLSLFRKKVGEMNPARNPPRARFEEQVKQAKEFRKKTNPKKKLEPEAIRVKEEEKVKYSKARTLDGLIRDLKKKIYPPARVVVGLIKKIKTRGVNSLTREEGALWNMLLKDEKAKKNIEKLWQKV